jgi:hypothetical protein
MKMTAVTVTTIAELKQAQKSGVAEILAVGELANDLKKSRRIATVGPIAIAALTAAAALAIPTGGTSAAVGFAGVATLTGMEIAAILFVITIGVTTLVALFKDYDAEFSNAGAKFTKKRK